MNWVNFAETFVFSIFSRSPITYLHWYVRSSSKYREVSQPWSSYHYFLCKFSWTGLELYKLFSIKYWFTLLSMGYGEIYICHAISILPFWTLFWKVRHLFRNIIYGTETQAGLFCTDGMLFKMEFYLFTPFPKVWFWPFIR